MLEYRRYRNAADFLHQRLAAESGHRFRVAPLPRGLRRVSLETAVKAYEAESLAEALGGLLRAPPRVDLGHVFRPLVSIEQRLAHLRSLLSARGRFGFDDAVRGADRLTEAVTLFALLELHKSGEATWHQGEPFGPIEVEARGAGGGSRK
jgi:segregation and condensation protein A